MSGPLQGLRVLEFAGLGPAPMACMLMADLGAEVLRIEPPGAASLPDGLGRDPLARGRAACTLDLKAPAAAAVALRLASRADVLVEGWRPGVAERLGIGPEPCMKANPRLIYARMTGWGQQGPLAHSAGHDLNFIAISGALHAIGRPQLPPAPPLNVLGDFGGGALYLVVGVLAALVERARSGSGQVVDAAVVDGVAHLMTLFQALLAAGHWTDRRGANAGDGGAPFYDVYETADGRYLAIAALEPAFFRELAVRLGLPAQAFKWQGDRKQWPRLREAISAAIRTRTRDEWAALLEGTDACASPVLSIGEAPSHAHLSARSTFAPFAGAMLGAPAPRFSRSACGMPPAAHDAGELLAGWGIPRGEQHQLDSAGLLRTSPATAASSQSSSQP